MFKFLAVPLDGFLGVVAAVGDVMNSHDLHGFSPVKGLMDVQPPAFAAVTGNG